MKDIIITKRESTNLKIDMCRDALIEERARRKKLRSDPDRNHPDLMLFPIHIPTVNKGRKFRFKGHYPIKSMDSAVYSNKRLCGTLSVLCGELRRHNLPYPWREEG